MRWGIAPSSPAYLGFTKESIIRPAFLHSPIIDVSYYHAAELTKYSLAREAGNGLWIGFRCPAIGGCRAFDAGVGSVIGARAGAGSGASAGAGPSLTGCISSEDILV